MDVYGALGALLFLSALCVYAAGYTYGKRRGAMEMRKILLLSDDEEDWTTLFVGDSEITVVDVPRPPLTLIDGGQSRTTKMENP
jgi:hypothetical protein